MPLLISLLQQQLLLAAAAAPAALARLCGRRGDNRDHLGQGTLLRRLARLQTESSTLGLDRRSFRGLVTPLPRGYCRSIGEEVASRSATRAGTDWMPWHLSSSLRVVLYLRPALGPWHRYLAVATLFLCNQQPQAGARGKTSNQQSVVVLGNRFAHHPPLGQRLLAPRVWFQVQAKDPVGLGPARPSASLASQTYLARSVGPSRYSFEQPPLQLTHHSGLYCEYEVRELLDPLIGAWCPSPPCLGDTRLHESHRSHALVQALVQALPVPARKSSTPVPSRQTPARRARRHVSKPRCTAPKRKKHVLCSQLSPLPRDSHCHGGLVEL